MDWIKRIPIGQYVSGKSSWLRFIDPRLKMGWGLVFLLSPVLADSRWRICLVIGLIIMTFLSRLPLRIWWRSFSLVIILSLIVGAFSILLPSSELSINFVGRPSTELANLKMEGLDWNLFKVGPLNVTRNAAELGINTSTLIFSVIHSVNLLLITTPPEELVWSLHWFMSPLAYFGLPIDRISFQLLLSLRFIPLVQEEFQNLFRSLATRSINIRRLGFKGTLGVFLSVGERLLANILLRAEQGADALLARGGNWVRPENFRPQISYQEKAPMLNILCVLLLIFVICLRGKYGA